ncbi:PH domain-containing protein [Parasphingorhabdus halotolerans]|uniref:PH domain-containing protein n=1 Tax=Parasphingorhabdus halotolerans TaxID=2725558 RepID=A0A6H2DNR9_9SPHN|nr:PH domain-containing protein [Parasphingorhabdus halotolerans]QJB69838.1 PH domain-containing protein [Parasphingorhabdus halotolerans]
MIENAVTEAQGGVDSAEGPVSHRLHPLTLLINFIGLLPSVGFALVALTWSNFDKALDAGFLWLAPLIIPLIFAIPMFFTWLAWSRFSYTVGAEDLRIQSGVLSRNNRSIPYERIQDVNVEQKLIARFLGLAKVKIETGGSGGDEDSLDAVSLLEAERLRDIIRDRKAGLIAGTGSQTDAVEGVADEEDSTPVFAMNNTRVFVAGLFDFSFILLALLGAAAQNLDFLLPGEVFDPRYWAGLWMDQEFVNGLSFGTRVLGILGAIGSLVFIGVASGVIRTFVREYGFRLDRVKAGFRRRRGLFTLTDMVMPIQRVQAAIIKTGPIRERFGWYHLKFQSLASDVGGESDHSAAPCAKPDEIEPIMEETGIRNAAPELIFDNVDSAMWWRDALILALALAAIAWALSHFLHPAFFALILLWIPVTASMILNWRRHRYALTKDQLFVHTGWWSRKLTILPLRKIQSVDLEQSPLDHPLNLATLTIGVAGGSALTPLKINHIDYQRAMDLRLNLLGPSSGLISTAKQH